MKCKICNNTVESYLDAATKIVKLTHLGSKQYDHEPTLDEAAQTNHDSIKHRLETLNNAYFSNLVEIRDLDKNSKSYSNQFAKKNMENILISKEIRECRFILAIEMIAIKIGG